MNATHEEDVPEQRGTRIVRSQYEVPVPRGGEMAVVGLRTGDYFALSDLSQRIWELTASGPTFPRLLYLLHRENEVEPSRLARDVGRFVSDGLDAGLLSMERSVPWAQDHPLAGARAVEPGPANRAASRTSGAGAPAEGGRQLRGGGGEDARRGPASLASDAAARRLDVIVVEVSKEQVESVAPLIVRLAAEAPTLPVVLYMEKLNQATVESLLSVLTPGLRMHSVIREFEPLRPAVERAIASVLPPCASATLVQRFVPDAPPPLRPFIAAAALRASTRPSVKDLARMCRFDVRTVDRHLERARWAPAHVLSRAFCAADVAWLMTQYGWSAQNVCQVRGFPDRSAVTHLMRQYTGLTPAMIRREGTSFREVLDAVQAAVTLKRAS